MVKVTDKNFYMDGYLKSNLEHVIIRQKKNWDNLIIIDGDPGVGKSTLALQIAYYIAWRNGKNFTVDNVFFDIDKLMEFANNTRKDIIVWDEAAFDGMAIDWYNDKQKQLVKFLFTARKYGHFLIFIIPELRKLQNVFAGSRSIALIRVYSPDNLTRGYFMSFGKNKKTYLHYMEKKYFLKNKISADFLGRFSSPNSYEPLIDMEKYEEKKDEAIRSLSEKETPLENKWRERLKKLIMADRNDNLRKCKEIADIIGVKRQEVSNLTFEDLKRKNGTK